MEDFSIFVPVDILEKGKKDDNGMPEELIVAGVASSGKSGKYDLDNQFLDVNGYDYRPFLEKGFLNLEHKGREDYSNIVGEPTKAFVKDNEFHIEGRLYKDNPKAVSIYQLGQILKKSGSSRRIGYSIEGQALEKDPSDPRRITKARITGCAITISPKNDGTQLFFKAEDINEINKELLEEGIDYDLTKAMVAGDVTGRDTAGKGMTQEPLKKESVAGAKPEKKKKKKDDDDDDDDEPVVKNNLTKGETYVKIFSMFNSIDVESAKRIYELTERIQKNLTPMAEVKKVTEEAFKKALETLNLVEPVAAAAAPAAAAEPAKTEEELRKAQIQDELKKAEENIAKLRAQLEAPAAAAPAATAAPVVEAKKEVAPVADFSKAEEKIIALGTVIKKVTEDAEETKAKNEELRKSIDNIVAFNQELAKKLGMIEAQPLDRKSVTTQKAIERFEKGEGEGATGGSNIKVASMSSAKDRAIVADVLYKAAVASGVDEQGHIKDQELYKAVQYTELGSFPNARFAEAIQARLMKEHQIKLVK